MAFENPSVQQFKDYFFRDFPYGTDPAIAILDQDIVNAYAETNINFNQDLWQDQGSFNIGYLLLSAHYLAINIQSSSQGISSQFNWSTTSKAVGSVSEGFQIPQRILDNPEFAFLSKTKYGMRYLAMILPQLSGQVFSVCGSTRP